MYMNSSEESDTPPARNLGTTWAQVAAVVGAVDATLGKWLLDSYGVGLTEYRAIQHLSKTPGHELRISELAHKVGLNQSSATRLVGRMEGKELAYRDTCPDDGRGVYAVITEKGLEAVAKIREPFEAKICKLLSNAAKQYPDLDLVDLDRSFETISKITS